MTAMTAEIQWVRPRSQILPPDGRTVLIAMAGYELVFAARRRYGLWVRDDDRGEVIVSDGVACWAEMPTHPDAAAFRAADEARAADEYRASDEARPEFCI